MFNLGTYNKSITKCIGVQVLWTVVRLNVSVAKIKRLLSDVGLDTDLVGEQVSNKVAFKRAGKALSKAHSNTNSVKFSRSIVDNHAESVLGIIREDKDVPNEELNYTQAITAKLDKATGEVSAEGPTGRAVNAIHDEFEHYKGHVTDDDIRVLLRKVVERVGGVSMRQTTGGVYFVPDCKIPTVVKLEEFLEKLNEETRTTKSRLRNRLQIVRLPDGENEKEVAWESVEDEITKKLEKITFAVGNIEKRMPFATKQADKLASVRSMLEYYTELCDAETVAQSINKRLQEAEKQVADKIKEIEMLQTED